MKYVIVFKIKSLTLLWISRCVTTLQIESFPMISGRRWYLCHSGRAGLTISYDASSIQTDTLLKSEGDELHPPTEIYIISKQRGRLKMSVPFRHNLDL